MISRPLQSNDLIALKALMAELGYDITVETLSSRMLAIRQNGGEVFVIEIDNKVVGCVNAIIDTRLAEGVVGEIVSLIVTHEYRGLGLGKHLIEVAEQWFKGRCSSMRIRANTKRHEAHQFYQSLGFEPIKTQHIFIKKI